LTLALDIASGPYYLCNRKRRAKDDRVARKFRGAGISDLKSRLTHKPDK
jgi:hypothetical protein